MAGNSGVGGAGQLNIELFEKELEKIEWTAEGHCAGGDTGSYTAKLWPWLTKQIINAALAAKAPQGVPARVECKCDTEYAHRCAVCGGKGYIDAPKLPVPVSDDRIHHGMVPHSSEVPCMTCGRPKPVIYAVNVQACPSCFQSFDTREAAAPKPAPPISEFTPEDMPVVTVSTGAPPNASPPSWRRSLAEKAKDEMSEFEKGFPYDGVTAAPGAEWPMLEDLPHKIANRILTDDHGSSFYKWGLGEIERLVREALAAAPPAEMDFRPHRDDKGNPLICAICGDEIPVCEPGFHSNGTNFKNATEFYHTTCSYQQTIEKLNLKLQECHASAERVRELVEKWRGDASRWESEPDGKTWPSMRVKNLVSAGADAGRWYADELERALPPSTGEKS